MNKVIKIMCQSTMRIIVPTIISLLLFACGADDNASKPTLGELEPDAEKNDHFIPEEIYSVSEKLFFFDFSEYHDREYVYPTDTPLVEVPLERRGWIIGDSFPSSDPETQSKHYARFIVRGLSSGVTADVRVTGTEGSSVEYAIDPARNMFGAPSYSLEPQTLEYTTEIGQAVNGDWIWVRFDVPDFDKTHTVNIWLENTINTLTGENLSEDGSSVSVYSQVTAVTPPREKGQLPVLHFADRVGSKAVSRDMLVASAPLAMTNVARAQEDIATAKRAYYEVSGPTEAVPVQVSGGEYCIIPRAADADEFCRLEDDGWTNEPGMLAPLEQIKLRLRSSSKKIERVSMRVFIGEGDPDSCYTQSEFNTRYDQWLAGELTVIGENGDEVDAPEPVFSTTMVCDEWNVDSLGDIAFEQALMWPPKTAMTEATSMDAWGYIALRDITEDGVTISSFELETENNVIDLLDRCNEDRTRCLWDYTLTGSELEAGSNHYTLRASTSDGLEVRSTNIFIEQVGDIVPAASFPSGVNNHFTGDHLNDIRDLTLDGNSGVIYIAAGRNNNRQIIELDIESGQASIAYDLDSFPRFRGGLDDINNLTSVQWDSINDQLIYATNSGDHAVVAIDTATGSSRILGENRFSLRLGFPMDIDYEQHALVASTRLSTSGSYYSVIADLLSENAGFGNLLATKDEWAATAVDEDNNRYLMTYLGTQMNALSRYPRDLETGDLIVEAGENPLPLSIGAEVQLQDVQSISVASWAQGETYAAMQAKFNGTFDPRAPSPKGFALLNEFNGDTIYKIDFANDDMATVFSSGAENIPSVSVSPVQYKSMAIEGQLGYAILIDRVSGNANRVVAVDLRTGERVVIATLTTGA